MKVNYALIFLLFLSCNDRTAEPNATLYDGEWAVTNNMWGATTKPPRIALEDYSQTVFRNVGGYRFGWRWKIDSEIDNVKGAPQVYTGLNPYLSEEARVGTTLPLQLSKIDRLYVEYDYRMVDLAASSHNVCWHMWVTDGKPGADHIRAELAVVLSRTCSEMHPVVDTLWSEATPYEVRTWTHKRGFPVIYIEEPRGSPTSGKLCLSDLLWYATTKGYITTEDHLACVALMMEVRFGAGGIMVEKIGMEIRDR